MVWLGVHQRPVVTSFMSSELAGARKLVDSSYHGYYTPERQRFQDDLVTDLVENNGRSQQAPVLLPLGFTEVLGRVQPLVEGGGCFGPHTVITDVFTEMPQGLLREPWAWAKPLCSTGSGTRAFCLSLILLRSTLTSLPSNFQSGWDPCDAKC